MTSFNEKSGLSLVKRNYILAVLVAVYMLNFVDRQILSILLEPIKNEMGFSDRRTSAHSRWGAVRFSSTAALRLPMN